MQSPLYFIFFFVALIARNVIVLCLTGVSRGFPSHQRLPPEDKVSRVLTLRVRLCETLERRGCMLSVENFSLPCSMSVTRVGLLLILLTSESSVSFVASELNDR
jgi:hypothetical protein